jgi:hypothetical protein
VNFDQSGNAIWTTLWNQVTSTTPGDDSDAIDMQAADWAEIATLAGSNVGQTVTLTLKDCDTSGGTYAVVSGWDTASVVNDKDTAVFLIKQSQTRRFVKVNLTKDGATATRAHVIARQWGNVRSGSNSPTVSAPT